MSDMNARSSYSHRSIPGKRRKNTKEPSYRLIRTIIRQVILSILLLLLVGIIKSINTPVTNFMSDKVKMALVQNLELKSIYSFMDQSYNKFKNMGVKSKDKNASDSSTSENDAVPASADVYVPEEIEEQGTIDYGGGILESDEITNIEKDEEQNSVIDSTPTPSTKNSKTATPVKYKFVVPVSGILGSPFGERVHPLKGTEEFHKGVDIKANQGVSIKAAMGGTVIEAGFESTYGNYIILKHQDSLKTLYAHCSKLLVKNAKTVKQGDVIAYVGSTGSSNGPHLHFEVWKNDKVVDPLLYIKIPLK